MVPTFSLPNIHNQPISFDSYPDAKGFAVVFTCNHCPYAIAYEMRLIALHDHFAPLGVPVIAINSNDATKYKEDSFERMKIRSDQRGFTFEYLYDESQDVAHAYGALKTPHVFLLWKNGDELEVVYQGSIDDNYQNPAEVRDDYLADAIMAKLDGKEVKIPESIPVGCSVKWK